MIDPTAVEIEQPAPPGDADVTNPDARWLLVAVAALIASSLCLAYGLFVVLSGSTASEARDLTPVVSQPESVAASSSQVQTRLAGTGLTPASPGQDLSQTATKADILGLQGTFATFAVAFTFALVFGFVGVVTINKIDIRRLRRALA